MHAVVSHPRSTPLLAMVAVTPCLRHSLLQASAALPLGTNTLLSEELRLGSYLMILDHTPPIAAANSDKLPLLRSRCVHMVMVQSSTYVLPR